MPTSTKYGYTVEVDLKPLEGLVKRLRDLDQKEIQWGYFEDNRYPVSRNTRSGKPVADIAAKHESGWVGRLGYVPPRPFFTQSLHRAKIVFLENVDLIYKYAFMGQMRNSMVDLAKELANTIPQTIDAQNFTPITRQTAQKKGSDEILVETGKLRNSVQAKLINNNPYGQNKREVIVK